MDYKLTLTDLSAKRERAIFITQGQRTSRVRGASELKKSQKKVEQAGADLCQAQYSFS